MRNKEQLELYAILLSSSYFVTGFRNKDLQTFLGENWKTAKIAYELRKLKERGAINKIKNSHYYRLTKESVNWLFYSFFNLSYFINPLLSKQIKRKQKNIIESQKYVSLLHDYKY